MAFTDWRVLPSKNFLGVSPPDPQYSATVRFSAGSALRSNHAAHEDFYENIREVMGYTKSGEIMIVMSALESKSKEWV